MNREFLTHVLQKEAAVIWDSLIELRPTLVRYDPPKIRICGRLWSKAGYCEQEPRVITLGYKFFRTNKNSLTMFNVILPHEIIHQADFDLYGDSEKPCGHGKQWAKLMLEYGLKADTHHSMEIKR